MAPSKVLPIRGVKVKLEGFRKRGRWEDGETRGQGDGEREQDAPTTYYSLLLTLYSLFTFQVKRLKCLMVKIRWRGRWLLMSNLLLIVFDRLPILWNHPVFYNLVLQFVEKRCMVARVRSVLSASAKFSLRFDQTWITSTFFSYKLLCISHLMHNYRYLSTHASPFQDIFKE